MPIWKESINAVNHLTVKQALANMDYLRTSGWLSDSKDIHNVKAHNEKRTTIQLVSHNADPSNI